jgi:protein tyrosine/serine phosphatase
VRCSGEEPKAKADRDPRWAGPLSKPGLPNLHQVSDALYRGAQPEPQGFAELHKLGVKTVVNLRKLHSDEDEIEESGLPAGALNYVPIKMNAWNAEDEDIVAFLKVMADEKNHPVFVHCQHGADRTGTMSAIYRIAFQGWSREDALEEMLYGGFGFHSVWGNLVDYLSNVDIERLKRQAGIAK